MTYLTLDDLAKRWGISYENVKVRKHRGELPEPDVPGRSPVWLLDTIEEYERGRDDGD